MSCVKEIPCNITPTSVLSYLGSAQFGMEDECDPSACYLCLCQKQYTRTASCPASAYMDQSPRDVPQLNWRGHGTSVWLMNHGDKPEGVEAALAAAREWFQGARGGGPGGHYKLRCYAGHWGLEQFEAAKTIPYPLSDALAMATDDAVKWFFDPEKMLPDPGALCLYGTPLTREITGEEIRRRIEGYQHFIDKETARPSNQKMYKVLPPLWELPEEQQKRLVGWWDRLWFDFLDLHSDWRWTPQLGFWQAAETVYPLTEEAHG